MENFFVIISGISFSLIVYSLVFIMFLKKGILNLLEWFLLWLATLNGLGFSLVIWTTNKGLNTFASVAWIYQYDIPSTILFYLYNFILVLSVILGWIVSVAIKNSFKKRCLMKTDMRKNYNVQQKLFTLTAYITLIISFLAYLIYTLPYGGFISYLDHSKAVRAGVSSVSNNFSFLKIFGGLTFFSAYYFFSTLLNKTSRKRIYIFMFLISFYFSLYILHSWAGRLSLVVFLLTFILGFVLNNYRSTLNFISNIFKVSILAIVILFLSDWILGSRGNGPLSLLAKELSFPFANFIAHNSVQTDYRWFVDIVTIPLYLLPERIWGGVLGIELSSSYNSFIVGGARKGEGLSGSIPIDMISFTYIQAPIIGTLIIGILWGVFLFSIENYISKIKIKEIRSIIYANLILVLAMQNIFYSDPQHLVSRTFPLISAWLIFLSLKYFKKIRIRR